MDEDDVIVIDNRNATRLPIGFPLSQYVRQPGQPPVVPQRPVYVQAAQPQPILTVPRLTPKDRRSSPSPARSSTGMPTGWPPL